MTTPVKLYVYDLTRGMARQMSMQLTGRQIDGIWHTSVVVFGKEIFYGRGISMTAPGKSHHGTPLETLDMGETAIDEETFNDYLREMRTFYTAEKYHLLGWCTTSHFNCNNFTADCVGFLTGGSIPDHIKDLPRDFLSTPFGQALRPTIDGMFQGPTPSPAVPPSVPPPAAASLLNSVASHAQRPSEAYNPQGPSRSHVYHIMNPTVFNSLLKNHQAVVAFFTSSTCPPCRMIEPHFERLAEQKGAAVGETNKAGTAAFAKINLDSGAAGSVAREYSVRVTPTFIFFLNGSKNGEMKGASVAGLESEVNFLLYQAHPPHPHQKLNVPEVRSISLDPILFTQNPPLDTINTKLASFIDASTPPAGRALTNDQLKQTISKEVLPYLKSRNTAPGAPSLPAIAATPAMLEKWTLASELLVSSLPLDSVFPLIDMWRIAMLDVAVGTWVSTSSESPLKVFLKKAKEAQDEGVDIPRNYTLVLLRTLLNSFKTPVLAAQIIKEEEEEGVRSWMTGLLVNSLLHQDANVRSAAAGLAFNVAAAIHKQRNVDGGGGGESSEDEGWQVELVSAIIEALDREKTSEDVVHRMVASLALLVFLSPSHETLSQLLEALQAKTILKEKLAKGGCGPNGVTKKDVRKLIEVTAAQFCPV
ncbi:thioredoxin family protein [Pluteus cervinus]|uniref:Thioredoxin family protein n=1 Tax=Pluteus cervinus TaxID=181527 RepID=A0ACD3AUY8_9AGAR|nr:thioredoxin family protein [Pluteus cervinus]